MDRLQINYFSQPNWPQNLTVEQPEPEELCQSLLVKKVNEPQESYHDKSYDADKSQVMQVESARSEKDFMEQMFNYRQEQDLLQIINSIQAQTNESTQPSNQEIVFEQEESSQQVQSSFSISPSEEKEQSEQQFGLKSLKKPIAKYRRYSQQEKQRIVEEAKHSTARKVAIKYNIATGNLSRWIKTCQRKKGAGRRVRDIYLEDSVKAWIKQEIQANGGVNLSRRGIQKKAKLYARNPLFKASKGWLERFANRNIELRLDQVLGMTFSKPKEQDDSIFINFSTTALEALTTPRASERLREKRELTNALTKYIYSEEQ